MINGRTLFSTYSHNRRSHIFRERRSRRTRSRTLRNSYFGCADLIVTNLNDQICSSAYNRAPSASVSMIYPPQHRRVDTPNARSRFLNRVSIASTPTPTAAAPLSASTTASWKSPRWSLSDFAVRPAARLSGHDASGEFHSNPPPPPARHMPSAILVKGYKKPAAPARQNSLTDSVKGLQATRRRQPDIFLHRYW